MTTRPYSEVLAQVAALFGADLAPQEEARSKIFINRMAKKAYAESELWPRFLNVGEERIVSEDGLLPYTQTGLDTIGTIYRIHATEPFVSEWAGEYVSYYASSGGIQIADYQAAEATTPTQYIVTGCDNPDFNGTYIPTDEEFVFVSTSNTNHEIAISGGGGEDGYIAYRLGQFPVAYWGSPFNFEIPSTETTPDIFNGLWSPSDAETGTPNVEAETIYSAFVTYKAALPTTYGDGVDEESDFPEEWAEYAAQGAYALLMASDGVAPETVLLATAAAGEMLEQQLEKLSRQGGAHVNTRILTHSNMQRR